MQSIPSLPSEFIVKNTSYKEVNFNELQVGSYYFMHHIVIEFYSLYDYILQVVSKSDNSIQVKKLHYRFSDNCIYPGDWDKDDEVVETISRDEDTIMRFYVEQKN